MNKAVLKNIKKKIIKTITTFVKEEKRKNKIIQNRIILVNKYCEYKAEKRVEIVSPLKEK